MSTPVRSVLLSILENKVLFNVSVFRLGTSLMG